MNKIVETERKKYNNLKKIVRNLARNDKETLTELLKDEYNKYNLSEREKNRIKVILLLFEDGTTYEKIANTTGLSKRTIVNYYYEYVECKNNNKPIKVYYIRKRIRFREPLLNKIIKIDEIKKIFEEANPKSNKEAMRIINTTYNINISESTTRRFLIKNNINIKQKR